MKDVIFIILYEASNNELCGDYLVIKDISVEEARRIYWGSDRGSILNEDINTKSGSKYTTDLDTFTSYIYSSFKNSGYDVKIYEKNDSIDVEEYVYKNSNVSLIFEINGITSKSIYDTYVTHNGILEILPDIY